MPIAGLAAAPETAGAIPSDTLDAFPVQPCVNHPPVYPPPETVER